MVTLIFQHHSNNKALIKRLRAANKTRNYIAHGVIEHYMEHHERNPKRASEISWDLMKLQNDGYDLVEALQKELRTRTRTGWWRPRALMERAVVILLKSTAASGHLPPNLKTLLNNFKGLLDKMALSKAGVTQRLAEAGRDAGYTEEEFAELLKQVDE